MKAMELHEIRFVVKSQIANAIYDAKFNIGRAWVDGKISDQQQEMIDRDLSNILSIATVAINNCESSEEIDEIVYQFEFCMKDYIARHNLPCKF